MKAASIPLRRRVRLAARRLGLDIHSYQPALDVDARRTRFLRDHHVSVLVDGGASTGRWARRIRENGYRGQIISFEPLAAEFEALRVMSAGDPDWHCVKAALGDADAEARINVAGNSASSSLLPMESAHVAAAPESAYVGTEVVRVVRLDSVLTTMVSPASRLALKLDLQGYESAALAGAEGVLAEVRVVECELSIVPLYRGQLLYPEMIDLFDRLGFCLAALSEGLTNPATGHVMQVDAIFVRQDATRPTCR
jgi:FkbM family methyltransferase